MPFLKFQTPNFKLQQRPSPCSLPRVQGERECRLICVHLRLSVVDFLCHRRREGSATLHDPLADCAGLALPGAAEADLQECGVEVVENF